MNLNMIKKRGQAVLSIVIVLILFILLNIFTGMLTERFFLKADLTESGIYSLSGRAVEFLSTIDENVDIIVLSEESTWMANNALAMIANALTNYSASSGGHLRVQYVDPDLNSFSNPKYENSLSVLKSAYAELDDMTRNDIIFLSSRRAAIVSANDLFTINHDAMGQPLGTGIKTDQEFVSALVYVLNESIARIVFVNNHQEDPSEYMRMIFERSGYTSTSINLVLEDIPEDTALIVSAAPKFDFLDDEIVKLERYLALGGSAMIIYDFSTASLPVLDSFLADWGVSVENKLIFDDVYTFIAELGVIGARVVSGVLPSTVDAEIFTSEAIPLGAFLPRPLRAEWSGGWSGPFTLHPFIQTFSESSYAKDINEGNVTTQAREPGDESGPFILAYNTRMGTRDINNHPAYADLIVVSAGFFDDTLLSMYGDTFYNAYLLADIANDLNPTGQTVYIPSRNITGSPMLVSSGDARFVLFLLVILLPVLIISAGIFVWRKRRHQ